MRYFVPYIWKNIFFRVKSNVERSEEVVKVTITGTTLFSFAKIKKNNIIDVLNKNNVTGNKTCEI